MKRELVLSQGQWVLADATSEDFTLTALKPGALVCYDRLAGGNLTKAKCRLTFGFKSSGQEFLFEMFETTVVAQIKAVLGSIYLPSEYTPFLRVVNGDVGDKIVLLAVGYRTPVEA
jgi:hypothetical protein